MHHNRTKYIDIQHHYIYNKLAVKQINLLYIPNSEMIADELKKALTNAKFHTFVKQMNIG